MPRSQILDNIHQPDACASTSVAGWLDEDRFSIKEPKEETVLPHVTGTPSIAKLGQWRGHCSLVRDIVTPTVTTTVDM